MKFFHFVWLTILILTATHSTVQAIGTTPGSMIEPNSDVQTEDLVRKSYPNVGDTIFSHKAHWGLAWMVSTDARHRYKGMSDIDLSVEGMKWPETLQVMAGMTQIPLSVDVSSRQLPYRGRVSLRVEVKTGTISIQQASLKVLELLAEQCELQLSKNTQQVTAWQLKMASPALLEQHILDPSELPEGAGRQSAYRGHKHIATGFTVRDLAKLLAETWLVPVEVVPDFKGKIDERYTFNLNTKSPEILASELERDYGLSMVPVPTTMTTYRLH
jgi:hypothetical protein